MRGMFNLCTFTRSPDREENNQLPVGVAGVVDQDEESVTGHARSRSCSPSWL